MDFAIHISRFLAGLPDSQVARMVSGQLLRSSSSVGANYRAAQRSKSTRDFINKLKIVEEESDESLYWLMYLEQNNIGNKTILTPLIVEANELVAIFVTSINTAKANLAKEPQSRK